ncbi:MAG: S-layer protein [Candidatus Nanoarchaeia archaeon]
MEIKTKKVIGKIAAIGTGLLMAVMPVAAATLADYPAPFVKDGQWNAVIVVGKDAAPSDVIGSTNIAATLAQSAVTVTEPTITGAVKKDVPLTGTLNSAFGDKIDNTDIDALKDTSIAFADETYDVHEELLLDHNTPAIYISAENDADFGKDPVIAVKSGGVKYHYVFDEAINKNISSDEPLEITFLGKTMTLTKVANNEITVQIGADYYLTYNDTVTVAGKTIKLVNVGSASAIVQVGSEQKIISKNSTAKVGGLRIKVKDIFYSDTPSERAAALVIGEDVDKTYKDGDAFYIPCATPKTSDCSKSSPDWEWDIRLNGTTPINASDYIGVKFVGNWDNSPEDPVIKEGQQMNLPENYLWIKFDSLKTKKFYKYDIKFQDGVDLTDIGASSSENVFVIKGPTKDSIKLATGEETDTAYLWFNNYSSKNITLLYRDPTDNKIKDSDIHYGNGADEDLFYLTYGDTDIKVKGIDIDPTNVDFYLKISAGTVGTTNKYLDIATTLDKPDITAATKFVGMNTPEKSEADDVKYKDHGIGERDKDVLLPYGAYITNVKSGTSRDEVTIYVPNEQQKVVTIIGTQTTKITGGAGGTLGGVAITKLDTEVSDPKATNLILVGGPAVNKLTAEALGLTYPTYGTDAARALGITENQATIKLIENAFGGSNVALIVAGWEASDTRAASSVLQDYTSYKDKLVGKQVIVSGTAAPYTVTSPTVSA